MKRWRAPFIRMTMLIAVFFAIWVWAAKDDLTGQARIVDGDSLEISGTKIYDPGNNEREHKFRESLKKNWKSKYEY